MALAMRLARGGRKGRPFHRIVVTDKRMPRDGRYIEKLGTYDPMIPSNDEKRVTLNEERIKYWLSEGAQPSTRVQKLLAKAGLMDAPEIRETPKKSAQSEKTKLKASDKEEKLKARAEAEAEAAAEAAAAPAEEAPAEEAPAEEAKAEEVPAEQPDEAPAESPAEAPNEQPAEAPVEKPAEQPAEAPDEAPKQEDEKKEG